jgi:hypothetical protein
VVAEISGSYAKGPSWAGVIGSRQAPAPHGDDRLELAIEIELNIAKVSVGWSSHHQLVPLSILKRRHREILVPSPSDLRAATFTSDPSAVE